jgi:hypothetical protein
MSKITPKNLSYDSTLPPFLARLRANPSNPDGSARDADRHEFSVARPKRERRPEELEEEEPTYVDEHGEVVAKEDVQALSSTAEAAAQTGAEGAEGFEKEGEKMKSSRPQEKVATIGAQRKRKAVKIIGGDGEVDEDVLREERAQSKLGQAIAAEKAKDSGGETKAPAPVKSGKKKGKKIKLSFGDDE